MYDLLSRETLMQKKLATFQPPWSVRTWYAILCGLALWLGIQTPTTHASTLSYGFIAFNNDPDKKGRQQHQIMLTDGYCRFIHHSGPFNRICGEAGVGFRFIPFAFDIHAQMVLHHIWLRPYIYGAFVSIGPQFTAYPNFHAGFRVSAGFHFYFVAPSIEYQLAFDTQGNAISRFLLQITIPIPTGSINFAIGNAGL